MSYQICRRRGKMSADWRDFESTPASKENPDNSITIFDYHQLLSKAGWKVNHRIECPLSSERMSGNQVQKMQEKRILGTVGRTLIIAKRSLTTRIQELEPSKPAAPCSRAASSTVPRKRIILAAPSCRAPKFSLCRYRGRAFP